MSIIGLVDTIASPRGGAIASGSLLAHSMLSEAGGKRSRRTWSPEEKQRIVAEAVRPGASVADIARRHGLNANLVFTWRRTMKPAAPEVAYVSSGAVLARPDGLPSAVDGPEFVPIGVFTETEDN